MSVPAIDRDVPEDEMALQKIARELSAIIVKVVGNKHFLPRKYRWAFSKKLADAAFSISEEIDLANSTPLDDISTRRAHQDLAIGHMHNLLTDVMVLDELHKIKPKKLLKLTNLVKKLSSMTIAWKKSDSLR